MTVSFQNGSFFGGSATANTHTTYGGVSVSSLYNEENLDRRYSYQDTKESYEISYNGRDAVITNCITNVKSMLSQGREDAALEAYNELLTEMKSQDRYSQLVDENGNDSQLRAVARQLIEAELEDGDLEKFIKDNAVSASGRSWQKTFFNNDKIDDCTEEDLLNAMCNMDEEKNVSVGQYILEGICHALILPRLFTEAGDALFGGKYH